MTPYLPQLAPLPTTRNAPLPNIPQQLPTETTPTYHALPTNKTSCPWQLNHFR